MKRFISLLLFIVFLIIARSSYAGNQTLTTYYPAPQGDYLNMTINQELTLISDSTFTCPPTAGFPTGGSPAFGDIFIQNVSGVLEICDSSSNGTPYKLTTNSLWTSTGTLLQPVNNTQIIYTQGGVSPFLPGGQGQGVYIDWNLVVGTGETDFINDHGGAGAGLGGFTFYDTPPGVPSLTTLMRITDSGNVGIGPASPIAPLEVIHDTTSSTTGVLLRLDSVSGLGGNGSSILFTNNSDVLNLAKISGADAGDWGGYLSFATSKGTGVSPGGTPAERMRIDENGNVGINNTSPYGMLETINAGAYTNIESSVNGLETSTGHTTSDYSLYMGADTANKVSYLQSVNWGVATAPLVLNARGGNVGVNTPSPMGQFSVGGGSTGALNFYDSWPEIAANTYPSAGNWLYQSSTLWPSLIYTDESTVGGLVFATAPKGSIGTAVTANWRFPLYLSPSGNVGVGGQIGPAYTLDISGNVHATGTITADSDMRLKQNILPLNGALANLDKLRGVTFEWNHLSTTLGHKEGEKGIGLIAQELQKAYPELVASGKRGSVSYLSIDYGKFSAVLLEAVKELKAQVSTLQDKVNTLQDKVNILEKQK